MRVDGTLYFILGDHLGSTSVVTDGGGVVKGTQGYYPYALSGAGGETRYTSGSLFTDRLYTPLENAGQAGQQELAGLGLYSYKARFYDDGASL